MPELTQSIAVCRHFGLCGGCTLQDLPADDNRELKSNKIVAALARHGVSGVSIRDLITVPPHSRRRATVKVSKQSGDLRVGFHAQRSHEIVDMRECLVLTPGLFETVQQLRTRIAAPIREGEGAEFYIVEADNGFDLDFCWDRKIAPNLIAQIAAFAPKLNFVRVTGNGELLVESAAPEVCFGKARVKLPSRAFLQPTREGEAALQARVLDATAKARNIVDLFSGCGTFSLVLAERARVHAVEMDGALLEALATAAHGTSGLKPVTTERRDLFRRPLTAPELNCFDAAVLDPPRAGALAQANMLVKSNLKRIAYVSCDAASFARDAKVLTDGGFRLAWVVGVDQFLWSVHVELAAAFVRD